jgi:hypothetical protein
MILNLLTNIQIGKLIFLMFIQALSIIGKPLLIIKTRKRKMMMKKQVGMKKKERPRNFIWIDIRQIRGFISQ